jgi:transposase
MVEATIESIPVERPEPTEQEPQGMPLDKAYDSGEVRDLVKEFGYTAHIRARGEEAQAIKHEAGFKARRWVVERTMAWLSKCRSILVRYEKKACNYLGLIKLACALFWYRKLW